MSAINHFNLRSFDLNLLLAFDVLMDELSVTRAAARLKIQQPAMSHALATLRMLLDDELFIRTGQKMEATPRAHALAPAIRNILEQTQETLMARVRFDPSKEERTFRLGINGQLEVLLLPTLMEYLCAHAPRARLLSRAVTSQRVYQMLDDGTIDLAIGYLPGGASWHRHEQLVDETHVCCFNQKLLPLQVPLSKEDYLAHPHALISAKDTLTGYLEQALERAGAQPRVTLASHNFMTLAAAAARAPMFATMTTGVARHYAELFGLTVSPMPFDLGTFRIDMIWHARSDRDPAIEWLRAQIRAIPR